MPLPRVLNPSHITRLRTNPRIPPNCWYYVACVTLSALNRPYEIPRVFRAAVDDVSERHGDDGGARVSRERQRAADRMREGLVRSAAVVGLPKVGLAA